MMQFTADDLRAVATLLDHAEPFFFPDGRGVTPLDAKLKQDSDSPRLEIGEIHLPVWDRELGLQIGHLIVDEGFVAFEFKAD
jgi:hypothetical protein